MQPSNTPGIPSSFDLQHRLWVSSFVSALYLAYSLSSILTSCLIGSVVVSVIQVADIMLFSRAVYKCTVDEAEYE